MTDPVRAAYGRRADEYTELLGSMDPVHPADRQLVEAWAGSLDGPILDVGCGPGHWTAHLRGWGADCRGIDSAEEFVEIAQAAYPLADFQVGEVEDLPAADASLAGVLCWYSLIHQAPERMPEALAEIARVLRPGGSLLLGFFEGTAIEAFEHAVVTAYFWPMADLRRHLETAGLAVRETRSRTGHGHRPHGAIIAERRSDLLPEGIGSTSQISGMPITSPRPRPAPDPGLPVQR